MIQNELVEHVRTIPKQDQQIVSLAEQQTFVTSRDITTENESRSTRERCDGA